MKLRIPVLRTVMLFMAMSALNAAAQSNAAVDRLLDQERATVADAAYLVLAASNTVPETAGADAVMAALAAKKLLPGKAPADAITLGEVSYLVMQSLGMRGGLLYTLFPGPRYAARELAWLRLVPGNNHPSRTVTGQEVMHILGGALELKGGAQ